MPSEDRISEYDYQLPPELIASAPVEQRDESRLLVIDRARGTFEHHHFLDLPKYLNPGDLLVMNDTRVVPARLMGVREQTGGKWEGLFLRASETGEWHVIGKTRGRLQAGELLVIPAVVGSGTLRLQLLSRTDDGGWLCRPDLDDDANDLLERFGQLPLPHYMQRDAGPEDRSRYQTVYAREPGAVAAPTAGLHFTPAVLAACRERGVKIATVTLHVGLGTFRPVSAERLDDHVMHHEWRSIPPETVAQVRACRAGGGRIVAVGTTTVRSLESAATSGELVAGAGETNLFIRPPFEFQVTDALLTNFHLPKSTLLVLVSTFAGRELILQAYAAAIAERYRFYSYGDAMLIV